jgi:hypothetical protein
MRELIGKIPTKDPNITEVFYLSEIVRCLECEQPVPMGIEVVTVKKPEEPGRLSGASAIAADTVLTTRRRRKVRRFALMFNLKRCDVSRIQSGARSKISRTQAP